MSTDVSLYSSWTLDERWQYAQALTSSGDMLPQALRNNAAKVFYAFETGTMLGIHPMAALIGINVIEGKPTLSPQLMSAVIRRAGHLIRVTVTGTLTDLSLSATAELVRKDDPEHPFISTWTIEKAQRAQLLQVVQGQISAKVGRNNASGVWEKYTEAMLKARAVGEVCREGGTDALMGVVYIPEELGAEVNEQGELVQQADPTPIRREPPQAADYRPIALAEQPATVVQEAAPEAGETDMDIVELYQLGELSDVIQTRQAYVRAQRNGHLDRPVQGKPLRQWLSDLAAEFELVQEGIDAQTGEVAESA